MPWPWEVSLVRIVLFPSVGLYSGTGSIVLSKPAGQYSTTTVVATFRTRIQLVRASCYGYAARAEGEIIVTVR